MLFQRLNALWGAVKKLDYGMVQALHLLVEIRDLLKQGQAGSEVRLAGEGYYTYPKRAGGKWATGFEEKPETDEEDIVVEHGAKDDSVTIIGKGSTVPRLEIRNGNALCSDCGYNWKTRDALDRALRRPPMLHGAPCPICGRDKGDYQ